MKWPTMTDYQEAIQAPRLCFDHEELKNGTPVIDSLGLPRAISGGFATVYQMKCSGKRYAVRCFLSNRPDVERRYSLISSYLDFKQSLPCMVGFEYLKRGIKVGGTPYPILKMEWIEADPFNAYIEKNLNNPKALFDLVQEFSDTLNLLRQHSIAHGDLQHGNILVSNGKIRLVDYDSLFVPGMDGEPSIELGHRNYQHPDRTNLDFGAFLDNFSAWSIAASLVALIYHPELRKRFSAKDEHLLFKKEDFENPSSSELFRALRNSNNTTVKTLVSSLESISRHQDLRQIPPLISIRSKITGTATPNVAATWLNNGTQAVDQKLDNAVSWLSEDAEASQRNEVTQPTGASQEIEASWVFSNDNADKSNDNGKTAKQTLGTVAQQEKEESGSDDNFYIRYLKYQNRLATHRPIYSGLINGSLFTALFTLIILVPILFIPILLLANIASIQRRIHRDKLKTLTSTIPKRCLIIATMVWITISLSLFIPIFNYLGFRHLVINSSGMEPTLLQGDHFFINRIGHIASQGDVICYVKPNDKSKIMISRVVAVGGDLVEIKNTKLLVNSVLVEYPNESLPDLKVKDEPRRNNLEPVKVPSKHVFVLGDNRDTAYDSRFVGFIPEDYIIGRAKYIIMSHDKLRESIRWSRFLKSIDSKPLLQNSVNNESTALNEGIAAYERKDYGTAFKLLKPFADEGNASAQHIIGRMSYYGMVVSQDYQEAAKWYRKAADQGLPQAQYFLAVMYSKGQGVTQDHIEGVRWCRKAADQGFPAAQKNLGIAYRNGQGVPVDYNEALKWYRRAADQGDAKAQFLLGGMIWRGEGTPEDHGEAIKWINKAANQEDPEAEYILAMAFLNGVGVAENIAEASRLFRKLADKGHPVAQFRLGLMHENGHGVVQDYREALKWYRKAADQGDPDAQYNTGRMYALGKGIPQDDQEAMQWFRKAADQGNSLAQYGLGIAYQHGGIYNEALKWYHKAAEQGNAGAQYDLAILYKDGKGVKKDPKEAEKWFRKAAEQGYTGNK